MAHAVLYRRIATGLLFAAGGLVLMLAYRGSPAPALIPQAPCMLLQATGLQCPFCGAQGALHALLEGQWGAAWRSHPLATLFPVLMVLGIGLAGIRRLRKSPPLPAAHACAASLVVLVLFAILRNVV